ncbi:hypothetical protein HAX54_049884 [Datura stramonium]|uniref:Uncharacterized protein n=1 Tax=Datura stramonium TaxID=4076 RepID=A0ABS8SXG6_DATST|nr:hypothetical protein [Datura stramonium]
MTRRSHDAGINTMRRPHGAWAGAMQGGEQQIDEEVIDYRPRYDPKGLDVMKMKESEGIHGPVLSINERNAHIDNVLSHLYNIQMLQLRMSGARVDFDLKYDDDGDDSEMGKAAYDPHK